MVRRADQRAKLASSELRVVAQMTFSLSQNAIATVKMEREAHGAVKMLHAHQVRVNTQCSIDRSVPERSGGKFIVVNKKCPRR